MYNLVDCKLCSFEKGHRGNAHSLSFLVNSFFIDKVLAELKRVEDIEPRRTLQWHFSDCTTAATKDEKVAFVTIFGLSGRFSVMLKWHIAHIFQCMPWPFMELVPATIPVKSTPLNVRTQPIVFRSPGLSVHSRSIHSAGFGLLIPSTNLEVEVNINRAPNSDLMIRSTGAWLAILLRYLKNRRIHWQFPQHKTYIWCGMSKVYVDIKLVVIWFPVMQCRW